MNKNTFLSKFETDIPENVNKPSFVPSSGPFDTNLVLVGEAPGTKEVKKQQPFIGPAGKRLEKALDELDVDRSKVYITNIVKEKLPDNRDPTEEEAEKWMKLLKAEIKEVNPEVVLALGKQPAKYIAGRDGDMESFRNKNIGLGFKDITFNFNVAYHPAATLYEPSLYDEFVSDIQFATQDIDNIYSDQNYLSDF